MTGDRSVLDVLAVGRMFVGAAAAVGVFRDTFLAYDASGLDNVRRVGWIEDDPRAAIRPKQPHVRDARTDFRLPEDVAGVARLHFAKKPERLRLTVPLLARLGHLGKLRRVRLRRVEVVAKAISGSQLRAYIVD